MRTSLVRAAGLIGICLLLTRCGGGGGGGSGTPATPTFSATRGQPANGATDVDPSVRIVVTFSEAVDMVTVGPQTLRVGILGEGSPMGTVISVPGSGDTVLQLTPAEPLESATQYAILIANSLRSATGHAIGGTLQFLFRTRSTPGGGGVVPPTQTSLQPTVQRMKQGRRSHTATMLADGRVLFCGGYIVGSTVTNKGEIFSAGAQTFTLLANRMKSPRASHAAVRLQDGRVLLCGGYYEASAGSLVSSASAEIFDPAANTFTTVASMGSQRVDHVATLLPNGHVLVTGGSLLAGTSIVDLASAEIFDPQTLTWSAAPHNLVHTHAVHAVVDLADGRFLVVGGSDTDLRPEIYTVSTGTFATIGPAPFDTGRFGAAVAKYADGIVTIVGGEAQGQHFFSPVTSVLSNSGSPTTIPRAYATVSPIGPGRMLVVGGVDYVNLNVVESSCDLLVQGGISGSSTYPTEIHFPTGMALHTATVLLDGRILFAGGINPVAGDPEYDGAYLFTPPP